MTSWGLRPGVLPWRAATLLVLVCALTAGACDGDDDPESGRTPTTSTARATSTTLDSERAAVLDAYAAFRRCYETATNPMNPEHPCIAETATGDELRTLGSRFLSRKQAGEIFKGTVETAPLVASLATDKATIRDCIFDRMGVYDAANPDVLKEPMDTGRVSETITLALVDGRWKVAAIEGSGEGCEAEQ